MVEQYENDLEQYENDYKDLQLASSREERLCKSRRLRGARVSRRGRAESWENMISQVGEIHLW